MTDNSTRARLQDYKDIPYCTDPIKEVAKLGDKARYRGSRANGQSWYSVQFKDAEVTGEGDTPYSAFCQLMENLVLAITPDNHIFYSQWWDHAKHCYGKTL